MLRTILISRAMDRMARLAHPPRETSPVRDGATPAQWAELAGLGAAPHGLLHPLGPVDIGDYEPADIAVEALGKLCILGLVEGWPDTTFYRPVRLRIP